jgi:hypothetical protein
MLKKALIILSAAVFVLALGCQPGTWLKRDKVKVDYSSLPDSLYVDGLHGCICGQVYLETGEAVKYGGVAVLSDSSVVNSVYTDSTGRFEICDISPGMYSVRFYYIGLNSTVVDSIRVTGGSLVRIKIRLERDTYIDIIQ